MRLWRNILVANLATNFKDLVAKVKNLVVLVPVLGKISRPGLKCQIKGFNYSQLSYDSIAQLVKNKAVNAPITFEEIEIVMIKTSKRQRMKWL